MFLDGISAVVLTMAIIEPMIRQAGFDMIWFGIFLVIVVEMAQITPPVGFTFLFFKEWQTKIWDLCTKCFSIISTNDICSNISCNFSGNCFMDA